MTPGGPEAHQGHIRRSAHLSYLLFPSGRELSFGGGGGGVAGRDGGGGGVARGGGGGGAARGGGGGGGVLKLDERSAAR